MVLTGVMLLRHLGEAQAADRLEAAVAAVIKEGTSVTYDFKPRQDVDSAVGTREMGEAIVHHLQ